MQAWRLLDTGLRPAAENMALDEVILTARKRLFRLPTAYGTDCSAMDEAVVATPMDEERLAGLRI